jgi:transcriptional regulator with XRE-family HTH domain
MANRVSHVTAEDIVSLREHHHLTQRHLADLVGLTQAMISHLECGRYPVSEAIAILLELAVCEKRSCQRGCVDPMRRAIR